MGRHLSNSPETPLYTHGVGELCDCNSSDVPLGIGGIFTGNGVSVLHEAVIVVSVYSDVASIVDGLSVEFSTDNINWEHTDVFTIPAATGKTFTFQPVAQYFRVVYTNGAVAQTEFRLQVVHKNSYVKPSSHRIADAISGQDDAELSKSILTAENPDGTFVNIEATASNNLRTTNAESGLAIAKGDVVDTTFIHKFGAAPDFDTADGFVTVWDGADDGGIDEMSYIYSTSAAIDTISSDNGADTEDIEIQGLDANYDIVVQTATLNGLNQVTLGTSLIRVFRMKNVGSNDLVGNVYCFEQTVDAGADGIPDDTTKIRAIIRIGHNQTLMAIYTIPADKTGYLRNWYAALAGAKKTSVHVVHLAARPFGQVFQTKHVSSILAVGTSHANHNYVEPEVLLEKTDVEIHVNSDEDQAAISAGFDIVLVDN